MEYALGDEKQVEHDSIYHVLILIVMEYALGGPGHGCSG